MGIGIKRFRLRRQMIGLISKIHTIAQLKCMKCRRITNKLSLSMRKVAHTRNIERQSARFIFI